MYFYDSSPSPSDEAGILFLPSSLMLLKKASVAILTGVFPVAAQRIFTVLATGRLDLSK